jgi:hypothetical protein
LEVGEGFKQAYECSFDSMMYICAVRMVCQLTEVAPKNLVNEIIPSLTFGDTFGNYASRLNEEPVVQYYGTCVNRSRIQ